MTKAHQPKVKYLVPSPHGYARFDDCMCQAPVRLTRCEAVPAHGPILSYGQYFQGITDVISRDDYRLLVNATARQLARDISVADIKEILIYAEKHGSDYHPARIEVMVGEVCAPFVMNVAVTERGKAWLCREFEVLQHLNRKHDFPFLPQTYFQGEASYNIGGGGETDIAMLMFLADWFQGYHEFHLSNNKEDGSLRLVLWDVEKGHRRLFLPQVRQIYSQAAMILTLYYDLETFEQIFPWHHAAGDFVVKAQEGSLDVRLVTARQYAPMLEPSEGEAVHEALLFFLLNLSVRMRLDRLDGVGAVTWADDECVDATLEGFWEGLRIKERQGVIEMGFVDGFAQHVRSLAKEDLSDRFHALIDACDQSAPDIPMIRRHLERHTSKFHAALQAMRGSSFFYHKGIKASMQSSFFVGEGSD
ncbi:MAG: hypothetical protein DRH17_10365 [Deltaproteobacteria bacterium]|nr:MAG: hypothetical protein DRH17_10365 [Deltaproteobacteria bacterium]